MPQDNIGHGFPSKKAEEFDGFSAVGDYNRNSGLGAILQDIWQGRQSPATGGVPIGGMTTTQSVNPSQFFDPRFAPGATDTLTAAPGLNPLLRQFLSPNGIASLAGVIGSLFAGRGGGEIPQQTMAGLEDAIAMTNARTRRADPLHEAVVQLAFQGLPVNARQGITTNRVPLPPQR